MTDQPHPDVVSTQSGISRYVITNEEASRTTVEATQWGFLIIRERDMDTKQPIRQSVFLDWTEIERLDRITAQHAPRQ